MKRAERSHVIVTGGAQGIGRIVTCQLIENGYNVSIFDIDGEAIEELKHVIVTGGAQGIGRIFLVA